jgi:hypothetical protein
MVQGWSYWEYTNHQSTYHNLLPLINRSLMGGWSQADPSVSQGLYESFAVTLTKNYNKKCGPISCWSLGLTVTYFESTGTPSVFSISNYTNAIHWETLIPFIRNSYGETAKKFLMCLQSCYQGTMRSSRTLSCISQVQILWKKFHLREKNQVKMLSTLRHALNAGPACFSELISMDPTRCKDNGDKWIGKNL